MCSSENIIKKTKEVTDLEKVFATHILTKDFCVEYVMIPDNSIILNRQPNFLNGKTLKQTLHKRK